MTGSRIQKIICGTLVAVGLIALPLPVIADNQPSQPSGSETIATTQTTVESEPQSQASELASTPVEEAGSLGTPSSTDKPASPQEQEVKQTPDAGTKTGPQSTPAQATITNDTRVEATSGNATVSENRTGGSATSGQAEAITTSVNVANSNGTTAGSFQTFTCDIRNNIQGNLTIDPANLMPLCDNKPSTNTPATQGASGSPQSGASMVEILNNIVLSAHSGNASTHNNHTAGDATSGGAVALANVVNIANSAITAKNSFVGVINIHSDMQGDILVPQSIVNGLTSGGNVNDILRAASGSSTITNTVHANATSGNANVSENRTAGNATSGSAATSLTVMNLTGQQVVAKNSLLVFVNVLGSWMGMIVPAPGGNTAMLGSGIQASPAHSSASPNQSDSRITNNITVSATSGNANVSENRTAGNATSGSAQSGVNLLNITDSNFQLDDWFGALFINVLGNWLGNFDIQEAIQQGTDTSEPIQEVKIYQLQQDAPIHEVRKVGKPTPRPNNITAGTSDSQPTGQEQDIEAGSQTTSAVLGNTIIESSTDKSEGFKLDLWALAAVGAALTLITAGATSAIRNRFHGNM